MSLIGRLNVGDTTNGLFIGTVNINNLDSSNNAILYSSDGKRVQGANKLIYNDASGNLNASGTITGTTITGSTLNSSGAVNASGSITTTNGTQSIILANTGNLNASGTITGATITGSTLNSSGNINASGTITTTSSYIGTNTQNWTQYSSTGSWAGYLGIAVSDTKVLVASPFNGIYSTTNGITWTTEISDFSYWTSCGMSGTNMIACAAGGSGVYANLGAGWIQQSGTAPFLSSLDFLSAAISGTNMITCANGGSVFTNLAGTWVQETSISTSASWYGVAISGSNMLACINFGAVYYNFSGTWVNTGLASYGWNDVGIYGTNMIAGSSNGGVWTNFGSGWVQESLSTAFNWNSVSIYGTYMIAAADGGSIWLNTGSGWVNQTAYGLTSGIRYFSCDIYNTRIATVTQDTKQIFFRNFLIPFIVDASGTLTSSNSTQSVIINPSGTINASGTITGGTVNSSGAINASGTIAGTTISGTNLTVNNISYTNMVKYVYNSFSNSLTSSSGASYTYFSTSINSFIVSKKCIFHISYTCYVSVDGVLNVDLLIDGTSTGTIKCGISQSSFHECNSSIIEFTPTNTTHTVSFRITPTSGTVSVDSNDNFSYVIYQII